MIDGGVIAAAAQSATNAIPASHAARRRICHRPRKTKTTATDKISGCVIFGVAPIPHMLSSLAELAPALHAHAINTAVPAKVVRAGVIFI
jgi:hypothetical protein